MSDYEYEYHYYGPDSGVLALIMRAALFFVKLVFLKSTYLCTLFAGFTAWLVVEGIQNMIPEHPFISLGIVLAVVGGLTGLIRQLSLIGQSFSGLCAVSVVSLVFYRALETDWMKLSSIPFLVFVFAIYTALAVLLCSLNMRGCESKISLPSWLGAIFAGVFNAGTIGVYVYSFRTAFECYLKYTGKLGEVASGFDISIGETFLADVAFSFKSQSGATVFWAVAAVLLACAAIGTFIFRESLCEIAEDIGNKPDIFDDFTID